MAVENQYTDMSDEADRQDLEDRVDQLESTISKMLPSRRDALKLGGAALVGGAAMSGTASAGDESEGTIGTSGAPVDIESEDINNADTVTTENLVVNNSASGPFGGGVVFEEGDSMVQHTTRKFNASPDTFFSVLSVANPVDVYGGAVYGAFPTIIRVTFGTNTVTSIGIEGDFYDTELTNGNPLTVTSIFPMKEVKKIEVKNDDSVSRIFGANIYTT